MSVISPRPYFPLTPCAALRPLLKRITVTLALCVWCPSASFASGGTWVDLNPNTQPRFTSADLTGVSFISASTGIIVGTSGTIFLTTNRGATWLDAGVGINETLNGVHFTSETMATAAGYSGTILRSSDGGTTWSTQVSGTAEALFGVHFVDGLTGTIVGTGGTILQTTDGGVSWNPQASRTSANLLAVVFVDPEHGFAVGDRGTILRTWNGGESWVQDYSGRVCRDHHGVTICNAFWDVCFPNNTTGFVAGYPADPAYLAGGGFRKTTSGGGSWTGSISTPPSDLDGYAAISFGSSTRGILLARNASVAAYCTENAGVTWTPTTLPALPGPLNDISHGGPATAFAVGDNGTVVRWELVATPTEKRTWGSIKSRFQK